MNAEFSPNGRRHPKRWALPTFLTLAALLLSTLAFTAAPAGATPWCADASSDPDGDGWGWENDQSCRVRAGTSSAPAPCQSKASDPDGDGWGWENDGSCLSALATDTAGGYDAAAAYNAFVRSGYTHWSVSDSSVYLMRDGDWSSRVSVHTHVTSSTSSATVTYIDEYGDTLRADSNSWHYDSEGNRFLSKEHDWAIFYDYPNGERTAVGGWNKYTSRPTSGSSYSSSDCWGTGC